MTTTDLATVEARLQALLDRYRPELVDGTIYGIPSLIWPGATGHDYFAAIMRARHTGRATFSFASLDDELMSDLASLLDRLLVRYRAEHA